MHCSHAHLATLAAVLLVLALGAACASSERADPAYPADPLHGEWTVESIEGAPVVDRSPAFLGFEADGRVYGNSSVNRVSGTWSFADGELALSQLVSTRMAGPPALMDQEQRLLAALGRVGGFEVDDEGRLDLVTREGTALVSATRR